MIEGDLTGLHQPATFVPAGCQPGSTPGCILFRGQSGFVRGGDAFDGLSPINAVFRFRVHLPKSPKAVLEQAGLDGLPDLPLYYEVFDGNLPSSRIDVEVVEEETGTPQPAVTYLLVTVDLTGSLSTNRPWFRMAAAWVYPDPSNWGLEKRRVIIPKLHVTNEGDGFLRGKGDWRLWAQLNNSSVEAPILTTGHPRQEWTRIVNGGVEDGCDFYFGLGCGEDHDFGGRPFTTNNPSGDRSLGPDLLVYPDQPVQLHLSGYEEDWLGGDSLGVIEEWHYGAVVAEQKNACENPDIDWIAGDDIEGHLPQNAGCGRFSVHYEIQDLGPVGPPLLSAAAYDLRDAYRLIADCNDDVGCVGGPLVVDGSVPDPEPPGYLHPLLEAVLPGEEFASLFDTDLYEKRENEEYVLNSLNVPALRTKIEWDLANEPVVAESFLAKLRQSFDTALAELGDEVLLDLQLLRLAIPEEQFEKHFGDVPKPTPREGTTERNMKGAGQIGSGAMATHLNLELRCDPLRTPNRLDVMWKEDPYEHHRFELDLQLEIACEDPSVPMKTHSGRGLGRLDGEPGHLIEWTFVDEGEGSHDRDRAGIRIISPDGRVVHEIRDELAGQVHARED
jgi:hypothetical protein